MTLGKAREESHDKYGSYIDCKHGLEHPQGGADFWLTFSGAGFEMGEVRPEYGMGPLAGDPQHPNLLGYIWMAVGIPSKQTEMDSLGLNSSLQPFYVLSGNLHNALQP